MKKIIVKIVTILISIFDPIISKNSNYIVYNSFPDLSDNSFAVFVSIINNYPEKLNIWLVKRMDVEKYTALIGEYTNSQKYKIVKRDSIKGVVYYLKAKYVFFTHGLYTGSKAAANHCIVNLWHGMPLKNIGLMDKKEAVESSSKYLIATSSLYRIIMAQAFGIDEKQVIAAGQPRNDLLFVRKNIIKQIKKGDSNCSVVFWAPTYRESIIGDIRVDGEISEGLPVVGLSYLMDLDKYMGKIGAFLIIKLHPMDVLNKKSFDKYNNILILNNTDWNRYPFQLYSLLGEVDILLTDYSSIYIDYLLLNRPIGFVNSDFNSYNNTRGFVFENPIDYMPGRMITNYNELKDFLYTTIKTKKDPFSAERKRVNELLNIEKANYSDELLKHIGFK